MNYWVVIGLALDLAGVLCLGFDLIRLQRGLRASATASRESYDSLEAEYGGVESWLDDLADQSEWVQDLPSSIGETPESFNAHSIFDIVREVSGASGAVAERLAGVGKILLDGAKRDEELSSLSLRFSYVGLSLLVVGFAMQIVGALSEVGVSLPLTSTLDPRPDSVAEIPAEGGKQPPPDDGSAEAGDPHAAAHDESKDDAADAANGFGSHLAPGVVFSTSILH